MTARTFALRYAAKGIPVLPCRGKLPLTTHGVHDATTDPGEIAKWPEGCNVGIATGHGLVVLDVDPRHGGDDALHELERLHGQLPATASVVTGGGGQHYYFAATGLGNSSGRLGPGLDLKGAGGYAVAPPSIHESGRRYEWDELAEPVPLPGWIRERLAATNGAAPPVDEVIAAGKRNGTLASMAGSMRRRGAGEQEIAAALLVMNRLRCKPPLPEDEVGRIAASLCRYEPAEEADLVSSQRESARDERNDGLPFTLIGDVIANAPPAPEWTWDGYTAPGSVALLAGRPKVGKSTLVFGAIAAMLHGRPFVGRGTRCRGVLMLSEEGPDTLAEKARMFGVANHPRFHVLLRRQVRAPWPEMVEKGREYCREHDLDVLILDTWDKWTGLKGDDENKAGPVIEALSPLMMAAGDGLTVLIVSHQRKATGDHGEAVRGSNALTGSVDVIVEIERVADVPHARVLRGTSRFAGTPEELAVELTDDGYTAHGDPEALRAKLDTERVLEHLGEEEVTADEIAEAAEMPKGTVHKRLGDLYGEGRVDRLGAGRKGDPFRWKKLSSQPHPLRDERKNGHNGWTPEAADEFIERAKEAFPGSAEHPLDGEAGS